MGSEVQGSAQPPAKKTADQIEKETLKKRISNDECRMSKECILPVVSFCVERPVVSLPSRASESNDCVERPVVSLFVERSILKKTERHAAQAPALRERNHPSTFDIRYSAVRF
jgi:hypothetical protein